MNVAITVDRTSSGKEHFEVLDGLRGTAAFLIVLFHVFTGMIWLCKFSGRLSYPLYITHIPFVYVLASYSWTRHPSMDVKLIWIFLLISFVIFVAWIALKYFDEPVRAWLTRRYGIKRSSSIKPVTA